MPVIFVLLLAMLLPACSTRQDSEGGMEVSAVLRSVHRCSRISPEIDIVNAPAGTASFEVVLQDRSDPRRFHGGGSWKNDNTGIIPEGALNKHYMGACPPAGTSRSYQYVVTAVDVNKQPLIVRTYIFEQE